MGRRKEPRIAISFPVVVRGFDSQGKPFSVQAETHDISNSGASLRGLDRLVEPGKKIEIDFRDQTTWYRVQWVGKNGSPKAGLVGVHCLEKKYIWNVPAKAWEADTYDVSAPSPRSVSSSALPWGSGDRRAFPRRVCRIEAEFWTSGSCVRLSGKVADISRNGCYGASVKAIPFLSVGRQPPHSDSCLA